jgi:mRNA-degrading endonuclease RelE of RelBE toxin-antitoxin system
MKHYTNPNFWRLYQKLPDDIKELAGRNFELLKSNPYHPSLHLKRVGKYWSVQIGIKYRVIAIQSDKEALVWF